MDDENVSTKFQETFDGYRSAFLPHFREQYPYMTLFGSDLDRVCMQDGEVTLVGLREQGNPVTTLGMHKVIGGRKRVIDLHDTDQDGVVDVYVRNGVMTDLRKLPESSRPAIVDRLQAAFEDGLTKLVDYMDVEAAKYFTGERQRVVGLATR